MNKQSGISLIEIMIALLIGLFLLGGILQMFSASQQTSRMQSNLARLQENGRFALDFLARDIRMAGYWGCLKGMSTDITGTDNNAVTGDSIDDGTDTIILKGIFDLFFLTPPLQCDSTANTPSSCCKTDPSLTANTCPLPLTNLVNCYADTSSTLTYKINAGVLQQDIGEVLDPLAKHNGMIEDIQDMQILYGIDSNTNGVLTTPQDGVADYYVPVNIANMQQVVSVRISLLVVSLDNYLTNQPIPYNYYINNIPTINIMPVPVPPVLVDRKIRRVFNATIVLRNHLP
jgi:type IV pilus assembly protein PilW